MIENRLHSSINAGLAIAFGRETHGQQSVMNKMECQAASDALGFGAKEVVEFDIYVNVNGEVFPTGCFEHRNGCFQDPKDFSPRVCLNQYKTPEGSCWPGPCICFDGCKDCEAGKYTSSDGNTSCIPCGVGKYSVAGAAVAQTSPSVCKDCLAGKYSDQGVAQTSASVCKDCPAGNYTDSGGQTSCTACRAGQYSAAMKQTCTLCALGQYNDQTGRAECKGTACVAGEKGTTNDRTAANACTDCAIGKYTATGTLTACISCAAGTYNTAAKQTTCIGCATGKSNALTQQTAATVCIDCVIGKYMGETGKATCISCAAGTYNAAAAQTTCISCSPGQYQKEAGKSICEACEPGSFTAINDTLTAEHDVGKR
eukprot:g6566.t1